MREGRQDRARRVPLRAIWLVIGLSAHAAQAADFDCGGLLRMHGLMRNAARVCGFSRYNDAIVARAQSCYETLGSLQGARALRAGAEEFSALVTLRSQDAVCPDLLRQFPMVVRR
ncbi:hypothetical protein G3T14_11315 [Methylobacterium sp. BTF04]|uniref:hypothetical protein n=1 Tax=Methylobacterium sp. BTF04 TaxID=2708300 RepID=UPI0013D26289|nr:hypothetical protein [Methylobacterium sp. BTF04]NEU12723.1 hypothetical protein [Methylobacterium sp. BTF04]